MSKYFENIFLSWRVGKGHSRIMVGVIENSSNEVIFKYIPEGVNKAQQYGFKGYPGLSLNKEIHTCNVLDLFSKRLINMDRTDTQWLLDFWGVDSRFKNDTLYMLAMTQGKMQTDSFEFLASFVPDVGLVFVTDIAGIGHYGFDLNKLKVNDCLSYEKESNNPKDNKAIKVLHNGEMIGYIKKGHNEVFWGSRADSLKLCIKSITNTSLYKELYVKIYS